MYPGFVFVLMNINSYGQYLFFTPRETCFGNLVTLNVVFTACLTGPVLYFSV